VPLNCDPDVSSVTNSLPQFQLRFSPALASKPKAPRLHPDASGNHYDPFENPDPALLVVDLPPSHILVLNKFAIVPEHFILATKVFKPQTHLLESVDLASTYACIEAYFANGEDLFAFFNSGTHSGASQPHRHIQLLPVARMRDGIEEKDRDKWDILANRLLSTDAKEVPFVTFSRKLHESMSPSELHGIYTELYREACLAVRNFSDAEAKDNEMDQAEFEAVDERESSISYNLAMTRTTLTVLPRLAEGATITAANGILAGSLALNGTVLAGTALVKSEAEWDALRGKPDDLIGVLKRIGIPTDVNHITGKI
jgi:sulfate adenylyltransferase (ADP) / ATP adenylyltransferase